MSEILYIEGHRVDITPNTINRTLQINDIAELQDRRSNYSNTIDLPYTPNNVKVFSFLGVNGNKSIDPYRKLKCQYIVNGIPLINEGYVVIRSFSNSSYKINIYDGIISLKERLKGKTLQDLNYADVNHFLTSENYKNATQNESGYIYAVGDFGYRDVGISGAQVLIQNQAPSLFLHTVWDKIFRSMQIDYFGDFFETNQDFKNEVISPSKGYDVEDIPLSETAMGACSTNTDTKVKTSSNPIIEQSFLNFQNENVTGATVQGNELTFSVTLAAKIDFSISYSASQSTYLVINPTINGQSLGSKRLINGGNSFDFSVNLSVNSGDVLRIEISASDTGILTGNSNSYSIQYSVSADMTFTSYSGGQFIDFKNMVGNISQEAIIKDVMQRYGLLMRKIKNKNAYDFIEFEKLLNDRDNAEDWSDKIKSLESEDYNIDYAKSNYAKYNYSDEIVFPFLDGNMLIDNQNASQEKTLFTSPYEIANSKETFSGSVSNFSNLYQVPIWENDGEPNNPIKKNRETKIKIFSVKRINKTYTAKLFNQANPTNVSNYAILSLDNMSMQYFLNTQYKALKSLVDRSKLREAKALLSQIDIYNLDFFKLKYVKQTGRFYLINKIKNKPKQLSDVEMIEIQNFPNNQPPTQLGVIDINLNYKDEFDLSINKITTDTTPPYFDPEFDEPEAVLFTGGFSNDIDLIDKDSNVINTQTEILASDFPLTIKDAGNTTNSHTANIKFKIKDTGSGKYSEVEGTMNINVAAFTNQPPVANAGSDITQEIDTSELRPPYPVVLDGSESTDDLGITKYEWTIISKPSNSTASISNPDDSTSYADLLIPAVSNSVGVYEIRLKVTDTLGATSTDTVIITVTEL